MANPRATMTWYALSLLLPLAQGIAFSMPPITNPPESPSPTGDELRLARRGPSTITTSVAPPGACGWPDGYLSQESGCQPNENCVLHSSDSLYPPALGCCPKSGGGPCSFWSTCYDSQQVAATPSLSSFTRGQLCTAPASPYCVTLTYPGIALGGPILGAGCANFRAGPATMFTKVTISSDSSGTMMTTVASMSSLPMVDGQFMQNHIRAVSATVSPTAAPTASTVTGNFVPLTVTATANSSTSSTSTSSSSPSSSSSSAGVIAGSVVGSVVGVAGLTAAIVMFIILRRRTRQDKREDHPEAGGTDTDADADADTKKDTDTDRKDDKVEEGTLEGDNVRDGMKPREIGSHPRELEGSAPVVVELPG